eukprot:1121978-Lingulodinium_polyedra.AAC.1
MQSVAIDATNAIIAMRAINVIGCAVGRPEIKPAVIGCAVGRPEIKPAVIGCAVGRPVIKPAVIGCAG